MDTITISIVKEGDGFVARCLDYDIVSQGYTRDEAIENIKEAVVEFLEVASPSEIQECLDQSGQFEQVNIVHA